MHTKIKRKILTINSTLLQASTKTADWRSVIPYVLGLRSLVARLPSCLCCGTTLQRLAFSRYLRAPLGARISYAPTKAVQVSSRI